MGKIELEKIPSPKENPFLTERANGLWKKLDKSNKPLSKQEIQKRAKEIKEKNS